MPALLVDLFGTLIKEGNDRLVHVQISRRLSQLVNGLNWREHLDLYKVLVNKGLGSGEAVWNALVRLSEERGLELNLRRNEVLKLHVEYHAKLAEMYGDSINALKLGKELFGKVVLVSDSDVGVAEEILRSKGIREFFNAVVVSGEVGVRKPNPKLFLEAMRRVNADSKDCVMVGDTLKDVEGAKAAGIKTVLLLRTPLDMLKAEVRPDALADTLTQAVKIAYELIK